MDMTEELLRFKETMSPAEIKRAYEADHADGHFFDRGTMRWFGDRMSSFGTRNIDGVRYLYRKPTAHVNVFGKWQIAGRTFFTAWRFTIDSDLNYCSEEETQKVWDHVAARRGVMEWNP
jgi:hypothetical protein